MIEEIVLDYLKNELDVPVYFENKNLEEYVVIGKSSSGEYNFTKRATFFLQSYSSTKYKASLLNEKVKYVMNNIIKLDDITYSKLNTDYDYTDTTKKIYRYQAVYDIGYF